MIGSAAERLPNSVMEFISNWNSLSPFNLSKKNLLKLAWMWTPKFLCWKIWLERNNRIFKEESRLPPQVVVKAWTMMAEALSTKPSIKNSTNLSPDEDRWLRELNLNQQTIEAFNPPQKVSWEIRLDEQEFIKWPRKEIRVKLEEAASSLNPLASCICPMHGD